MSRSKRGSTSSRPRGEPRAKIKRSNAGLAEQPGQTAIFARIHDVVRQIPEGCVATYGQVALIAGAATPRIVGFAMGALPNGSDVPWQRVINSQGRVSLRRDGGRAPEQARRLRAEGVLFDRLGRVDFETVGWTGPAWDWLQDHGFDIDEIILRSRNIRRRGAWVRWHF